ncbi:unnamed protein product [Clonostachys rosea f. rosea IK726]|uniref:Uncharacterized protein n=1 Tax=Clonostachys rosea f. rosea IK726 TaxID=1349383 RepID=A0ACA9U7Q1_BIOOC|nr:unnamed protein product [Clonostachys rosea f. rosea IK726]
MGSKPGSAMSTQDRATYARAGATIAHHDVNMRQPEDVLAGLRELMAQRHAENAQVYPAGLR